MYPVSDTFLSSVRKSHISTVRVEIYDVANNKVISTASPVSGEITPFKVRIKTKEFRKKNGRATLFILRVVHQKKLLSDKFW